MQVKLLVSRCGPNGSQDLGETITVSNEEGERMIAAGQAEIVRAKAPEKAVKRHKAEKAAK